MEEKYCPHCESLITNGSNICSVCGTEIEHKLEPKTIIRIKSDPESEKVLKSETEVNTELSLQSGTVTESKTDLQSEPVIESKTDLQSEPVTESKTDLQSETVTESKTDPQAETVTESKTDIQVETVTENKTDLQAESVTKVKPDRDKEVDRDAKTIVKDEEKYNNFEIPVRVPSLRKSVYEKTIPAWEKEDNFIDNEATIPEKKSRKSLIIKSVSIVCVVAAIFAAVMVFMPKAKSIETAQESLEMVVEEVSKIQYTVKPEKASVLKPVWSTSDENVAIVENGTVKAVGEGQCSVTVRIDKVETQIPITVFPKPEKILISKYNRNMVINSTQLINYTVSPENANKIAPTFYSSNSSVVSVKDGQLTAVSAGECDITITVGSVSETIHLAVLSKAESIDFEEHNLDIVAGETKKLSYTISPATAQGRIPKFSSSDEKVAVVDESGTITAVAKGSCEITTVVDGKKDTMKIKVIPSVESILLSKKYLILKKGEQKQIEYSCEPEDASNYEPQWISENENVAKVSYNGKITAEGSGQTYITLAIGEVKSSVTVFVLSDLEEEKMKSYSGTWTSLGKRDDPDEEIKTAKPVESMLFLKDDYTFFLNIEKKDYKGHFAPYSGYFGETYFDGILLDAGNVLFLCEKGQYKDLEYLDLVGMDLETYNPLNTYYLYVRK